MKVQKWPVIEIWQVTQKLFFSSASQKLLELKFTRGLTANLLSNPQTLFVECFVIFQNNVQQCYTNVPEVNKISPKR